MKALFLAVGAAAIAATVPASAAVTTIGGSFAEACYHSAEQRTRTMDALDTCNRAFSEQALSFEDRFATHVNRGIVRMFRSEYDAARSDFDQAIAMDGKRSEPWLNKAVLHFRQGDSAGSIALFQKALELGTDRPEIAYYGRGLAYEEVGNIPQAYSDIRRAVSLKPSWAEPARELARYRVVQR